MSKGGRNPRYFCSQTDGEDFNTAKSQRKVGKRSSNVPEVSDVDGFEARILSATSGSYVRERIYGKIGSNRDSDISCDPKRKCEDFNLDNDRCGNQSTDSSKKFKRNFQKHLTNRERNRNSDQIVDVEDSECRKKSTSETQIQESVNYYEEILKTLKQGVPDDSRELFASNVLHESAGKEVELSCHSLSSHCIELLLLHCNNQDILRRFMVAFAQNKEEVCTNANASHITELLINLALHSIKDWSAVLENDDERAENVAYFISWITDFGQFVLDNFNSCLGNIHACHVLCTLINALGGDMTKEKAFMSKKSADHKKDFQNQYAGENAFGATQPDTPVVLEQIPESFAAILKGLAKALIETEFIIDCVTDSSASTVIQALLFITKKRLPKRCKRIVTGLMKKVFAEKNSFGIPLALLHKNCSYVVEKMFEVADEELLHKLWNECFAVSLEALVTHSIGNFIVQRLFEVVTDKSHFETMCDAAGKYFDHILRSQRYGVILSVAKACNRLKAQQAPFMKNIMISLQCAEPEERQVHLVPLLLGLQKYEFFSLPKDSIASKLRVCLQGSLLAQEILNFNKPIRAVKSILHMKPEELVFLACHMQGCYVLHSFFKSIPVGEKNKDKLIQHLKPVIANMACDRSGSLTLSRLWILLSLKQRSSVAQSLVEAEQKLQSDRNGSIFLKKCALFHFKRNYEKWKEIQISLGSSK